MQETKTLVQYELISLDVWGGEEPGEWDINNFFRVAIITLEEGFNDRQLIEYLIEEGWLAGRARGLVEVEDFSDNLIIIQEKSNGYPLYHLQLVQE